MENKNKRKQLINNILYIHIITYKNIYIYK